MAIHAQYIGAWPVGGVMVRTVNVAPAVGYGTWAMVGTGALFGVTVFLWERTA